MLLKLWSGALQTNRRTWTSQYLLCFLIYTHRYNSICSKFPPNAVNVNVFWSFPLLLPLLLLGCWRLVFPPMAADCNISPLAMFWNIIYSVFTVQFRIFEVPPTLTHTAPSPRHQVIICHNKPTWHVRIYLVKVVSSPTFMKPYLDSFDQCAQVIHKMARTSFHPTAHSSGWKVARYSCQGIQKSFHSGTSIVEKQCNGGWQIVRRKLWCQDYFQRFRVMKDTIFIGLGSDHHILVTKGRRTHKC